MTVKAEDIVELLEECEEALSMSALAAGLGVGKRGRDQLRVLVRELENDGRIVRAGRRYQISGLLTTDSAPAGSDEPLASGLIRVHPAGYGFVERDDGFGDVFVPARYRGAAMDGDHVRLYTWQGYKGTEGRVDEVLSRGRAKLTGVLRQAGRSVYLEPDDPRIATDFGRVELVAASGKASIGKAVVAEIVEYPTVALNRVSARVVKILGDPEDPNTEIEKIIACADIPSDFPDDVVAQAEGTAKEVRESDLADRIDLRDRPFLTIDPETARDFDDALCIEVGPHGGPRVWVAVADVSHYVVEDSSIDQEAIIRGVSVYLPDRVIPMLPFQLSSGICSLSPEVDRCAMVVRLDFQSDGELVDTGFAAAVIRSHARLDYPGVAAALAGDLRGRRERYRRWLDHLRDLRGLSQVLRRRRRDRGTLELEIAEAKVLLDADDPKLVRDVVRSKADPGEREAYELVEEFMIAANEAVGSFFRRREAVAVWRVHAPPDLDRLEQLMEVLAAFAIHADAEEVATPLGMRALLARLEGHPAERALSFQVLRSLQQAVYSTENIGHFGLASNRYLHFTSPIRRYPDLVVHRLLKYWLHREGEASGLGRSSGDAPVPAAIASLAKSASTHERRAIGAEREAVSLYRSYLMRDQVGEEFVGTVSGVTSFGAFVEIDDPFVEGLVKVEALGDERFDFNETSMLLSGRSSGLSLGLGDRIRVEVVSSSIIKRRIELRLVSVVEVATKRSPNVGKSKKRRSAGESTGRGRGSRRRVDSKKSAAKKSEKKPAKKAKKPTKKAGKKSKKAAAKKRRSR